MLGRRVASPGGRVVVISGASAGLGRAAVRAFAANGDHVGLLARNREALDAARTEAENAGVRAVAIEVDVADAEAVEAAAEQVERELGPIDVWVNNAMTSVLARVWETTPEDFRRVTEVTYLGFVHGALAALRRMRPRNSGVIVQVGSALAHRAIPLQASYCGAKHAIRGFNDALRVELANEGSAVRVTMVQFAGLNTPQFGWVKTALPRHPRPVAPVYQPEVAADAVVWASHHPRREIWVGASTPLTIWGSRVVPGIVDRYLARTNIEGQQSDRPIVTGRPDNLWQPVPGDHGAHGIFDDEAHSQSILLKVTKHRWAVAAGAGVLAGAAGLIGRHR